MGQNTSWDGNTSWASQYITPPAFYGTQSFITVFTKVRTGVYPDPKETSPQVSIPFLKDQF
jgi:hypothetical protein